MNPNWKPVLKRCMEYSCFVFKRSLSAKELPKAVEAITSFLSMLANYYDKDRKGELKLDE